MTDVCGIELQNLNFESLPTEFLKDLKDARISLSSPDGMLVIKDKEVLWYKGDLLARRLIYETEVLNAFFTHFSLMKDEKAEEKTMIRQKVLIVLLVNMAYIYFEDGRSYLLSFPFSIENGLPQENGVVLEKSNSPGQPFITLTEPTGEFGSIVSSSTTSISPNERLISFPQDAEQSIALTYDGNDNVLKVYHVRFLSRSAAMLSSSNGSLRRKASVPSRKASQVKVSGETIENQGELIIEKKRSTSHSGVLSIDRMASYDYNGNLRSTEANLPILSQETSRKDAILSKMYQLNLKHKGQSENLECKSIVFHSKEAVIIQEKKNGFLQILFFERAEGTTSTPRFIESIDLTQDYKDYSSTSLYGFIILLSKENKFVLYNPFLNLSCDCYTPSSIISKIHDFIESKLVCQDINGKLLNYNMVISPSTESIENCLKSLKYLVNSYTYNYLWVTWIYSFSIVKHEWNAFILTILSAVIPVSISPSDIQSNNLVSDLLLQIGPLQQKAIEDGFSLKDMAPNIILALHIIREDLKLNIFNQGIVCDLGLLLAQLTLWLSWSDSWVSYYDIELETLNRSVKFPQFQILESPPDIMQSLTSLFEPSIVPYITLSQLAQESEQIDEVIIPRTSYVLRLFEAIMRTEFTPKDIVNMMAQYKITKTELDTYPIGIVIPLSEAISICQEYISGVDEELSQFDLIDRKDLKVLASQEHYISSKAHTNINNQPQQKDVHQIISSMNDPQEAAAPLEHDRFNIVKLIFSKDRRFYEVSKLLQTSKIQALMDDSTENLTENALIVKSRELAVLACIRTLTVPIGRSSLLYSSKFPLITEKFLAPRISFHVLIQPQGSTVTIEPEHIYSGALEWGQFHNGASTGLTVSRDAKGISGSWVMFNKPTTLNAQHGGFLLGLGLNGHLKSLEEWSIFNYLGPKDTFTSVGLLLGMSASLKGTMDIKLTKVLSVHVVALLPHGASDMIISIPIQTAGILGIGLLYAETQHRRMSETMLSQITSNVYLEDRIIADESYRLAAGLALGYINLGKGDDLKGLNDSRVIEKLFSTAVSMRDVQSEDAFDKSMSGALMALTLIYLKTNNEMIAKKLQVPDTQQLLDYIRPDIILLRSLSKNLILWDQIGQTKDWIEGQIPAWLVDETYSGSNENTTFYYILSGLCLAMAIKYASTSNETVKAAILGYYDEVTKELSLLSHDTNFNLRLKESALIQTQTILALSSSIVMAATGDIDIFRRLRILHGKLEMSGPQGAYGQFMATNMALGFLFLGGGQYAFNTSSKFAVAALLTAVYPLFPNCTNGDPEVHLQALRHFWALSIEPRCLILRDVETFRPVKSPVSVKMKDGEEFEVQTPCLLPELSTIEKITTLSDEFHKLQVQNLSEKPSYLNVYVYKKRKIEVLKKSVELLLSEINSKFEEDNLDRNKLMDLKLFHNFNKYDVSALLAGSNETEFTSTIIDKQIELTSLAQNPRNMDDLWNLKLIFAYYDRILNKEDTHYLSLEFVDNLKILLWTLMNSQK